MNHDRLKEVEAQLIRDGHCVASSEIPNIDLYMDQVTTFMDQHLGAFRQSEDEKILTKTMINNYAKSGLLPAPVKKKYNVDHMLILIWIYHLKNTMSITDIKTLLDPVTEEYYGRQEGRTFSDVYDEIMQADDGLLEGTLSDVEERFHQAEALFANAEDTTEAEKTALERLSFVTMLGYDISIRQRIIGSVIADIREELAEAEKRQKEAAEAEAAARKAEAAQARAEAAAQRAESGRDRKART